MRLVTWNCRSGPVAARLAELSRLSPDVVFLQECSPDSALPPAESVITRRVNARKGIALAAGSSFSGWRCEAIAAARDDAGASIAGKISRGDESFSFSVLGLWTRGKFVDDALRMIACHEALFAAGPTVVMGDFNSGTDLRKRGASSRNHQRLVDALESRGLVSAYHVFHRVVHGREAHATYYHRFDRQDRWHIDFCFVPLSWAPRITSVVVPGPRSHATSDHRPVMVEVGEGILE
jgi:exonuclease III